MKIKLGYFIIILQIILVFFSNFLNRFLKGFDQSVQLTFSGLFILLLLYFYNKKIHKNTAIIIVLAIAILIIGIIRNQFILNLFELILIMSNFIYIFFWNKLDEKTINKIIKLILLFSFFQLFFDLLFPKNVIDLKDQFSGTFVMANNKSRFLLFILPFVLYLPKTEFKYNKTGKILLLTSIVVSAYLGYSTFGALLFLLSVILAFFIKNIYSLLFVYLILFFGTPVLIKHYYIDKDKDKKHYSSIEMNYERFYNPDHGVKAVYLYGIEKLKDTYFVGVGYGNFSSRAGQKFNSEITKKIPKQLIKFWQPLFSTKAPYGLSSLFVLFVELGVLALIPFYILFTWLNRLLKCKNLYFRIMVIFTFFLMNYNPTFFEFNESFLYLITLIAFYKKLKLQHEC